MGDQFDQRDQHPSVTELFAYLHSELSANEDYSLQEHLTLCGDCCVLLLEMEAFCSEPNPEPPDAAAEAEFETLWKELQGTLSPEQDWRPARLSIRRQLRFSWTLAATLALVALGLSLRVGSLEQQLVRPTSQVAVLDLPASVTRGEESNEPRIPAQAERILILFHLKERPHSSSYGMRLLDSTGAERLRLSGLRPDRDWNLIVDMPRALLPSGRSRFVLSGQERKERDIEYWVRSE